MLELQNNFVGEGALFYQTGGDEQKDHRLQRPSGADGLFAPRLNKTLQGALNRPRK